MLRILPLGVRRDSKPEPPLGWHRTTSRISVRGQNQGGFRSREELYCRNEVLGDRISRLDAASLQSSASLDLTTVLSELVESGWKGPARKRLTKEA